MPGPNPNSILDSVKKTLGIDSSNEAFDLDITLHINSVLVNLQQLGAGPSNALFISDNSGLWSDFTTDPNLLGLVKQYIYIKVRSVFDPSENRFLIQSTASNLLELEWRINLAAENSVLAPTIPTVTWWDLTGLSDFPAGALAGDFGVDFSTCNIYVNGAQSGDASWWDLTGLTDFPTDAVVGELGYDTTTGQVWRKTA